MRVLVGCEESQTITRLARDAGHEAFSCDIQPTRGNPAWHYQADIFRVINNDEWDVIILHPPCTHIAVSGNRWYGKGTEGYQKRIEAIAWTTRLWETAKRRCNKVALENPVSTWFKGRNDVHYVQPWQFGHGETKKTGFALYGLPPLEPTNIVEGRKQKIWSMGPSETRSRDRSVTYEGIARAIVEQWLNANDKTETQLDLWENENDYKSA